MLLHRLAPRGVLWIDLSSFLAYRSSFATSVCDSRGAGTRIRWFGVGPSIEAPIDLRAVPEVCFSLFHSTTWSD